MRVLAAAQFIVLNDGARRLHDDAARAVIALQAQLRKSRVVRAEELEVFVVGAVETKDGLVIVAHCRKSSHVSALEYIYSITPILMFENLWTYCDAAVGCEARHKVELCFARVLEFVHEDVRKEVAEALLGCLVRAQQACGLADE